MRINSRDYPGHQKTLLPLLVNSCLQSWCWRSQLNAKTDQDAPISPTVDPHLSLSLTMCIPICFMRHICDHPPHRPTHNFKTASTPPNTAARSCCTISDRNRLWVPRTVLRTVTVNFLN